MLYSERARMTKQYEIRYEELGIANDSLGILRHSGDVDVWVDGGLDRIMKWVTKLSPTNEVNGHHIHFGYFNDTEVELHYIPLNLPNPIKNMCYISSLLQMQINNLQTMYNYVREKL